jgi:hypothetical protein
MLLPPTLHAKRRHISTSNAVIYYPVEHSESARYSAQDNRLRLFYSLPHSLMQASRYQSCLKSALASNVSYKIQRA